MSAWVVTKHHIDLLVSAAIEQEVLIKLDNLAVPQMATEQNAQALGAMLWAENIRSVVYRYSLSGTDEEKQYQQDLNQYQFCRYEGIRPSAIAAALACFNYQACECPDYEGTTAACFVRQLRASVGEHPKGYDREPWGFDSEAQVVAVTAAMVGAA
jgi:hypothetical protein